VEALAEVLHGNRSKLLRIDCGEFQTDHEIAKLVGAPPGYVGHAQSQPRLNAGSLDGARSEECDLALSSSSRTSEISFGSASPTSVRST
jgi:hypothetical protein